MDKLSFLGQGWGFPPAFVKGSPTVVELTQAAKNIEENLNILLSTQIGERLMQFGYGTKLKALSFGKMDSVMVANIEDTVKRAILLNEPRIRVLDVDVDLSQNRDGIVQVKIDYVVIQTNDRSNFVYPFHLTEGTNLSI